MHNTRLKIRITIDETVDREAILHHHPSDDTPLMHVERALDLVCGAEIQKSNLDQAIQRLASIVNDHLPYCFYDDGHVRRSAEVQHTPTVTDDTPYFPEMSDQMWTDLKLASQNPDVQHIPIPPDVQAGVSQIMRERGL